MVVVLVIQKVLVMVKKPNFWGHVLAKQAIKPMNRKIQQ